MNNEVKPLPCEYLFVYGTLKRDMHGSIHPYLAAHADYLGNAEFQGKLYQIAGYPGVVASDDVKDQVHGEVYVIRQRTLLFAILDRYEECSEEFSEPHEYCRRMQTVALNRGDKIIAWMYLYNRSTVGLHQLEAAIF